MKNIMLLGSVLLSQLITAQNDLKINKYSDPEWDDSTRMTITIQNKGAAIFDTVWLKISDADLSISDAKCKVS